MEEVGLFYGHLIYFMDIWYILPRFGIIYREKSGNHEYHCYVSKAEFINLHCGRNLGTYLHEI
jgi:hypothetical protein